MTIETNMYDQEETVFGCTVMTIKDSVHYEMWYPVTKHLVVGDPYCENETIDGCMVQILLNTKTGHKSYGWMRGVDLDEV